MSEEKSIHWKWGFLKAVIENVEHYCEIFAPDKAVENILLDIERTKEAGALKYE